jgi:MFS family permease
MSPASTGAAELKEQHVAELVGKLAEETSTLMRQEVELAKAELLEQLELMRQESARRGKLAGLGSAFLAGAVVVGMVSAGLIAALLVALFDLGLPVAAAVALTLAIFLAATGVLAFVGVRRLREAAQSSGDSRVWRLKPDQTIETLKEDVEWAKHPTRSAQR